MPNLARRTIAFAVLAVAVIAAAVALDLPSAAAQSDDEQAGRIVARRLDDGRTEFGWQPSGGERVLPRLRYFPASVGHNRWLNSSPIEVDGEEIGRINVRLADDGRLEFAFTPPDGERVEPQARYFPTGARVGRWLRSTEIAISAAPTAGFSAVSAGGDHSCGLRDTGAIECWGSNEHGQAASPAGSFIAISAGRAHTCAIRTDGAIECWGSNLDSWGNYAGQITPPAGSFAAVSAGERHNCAIRESGEIECWGSNNVYGVAADGEVSPILTGQADAPSGSFTAVGAGTSNTCAIRTSGAIECWGWGGYGQSDAPSGSFTAVSAGLWNTCAIRTDGAIECWGWGSYGQATPPSGSFTAVSIRMAHACALRTNGEIECWGSNEHGQADAPAR